MSTHSRPNLWGLLSETSRIISGHPRHFLALSLLFRLPISFSTIIYYFLLQPTSVPGKSQFLIQILYSLFVHFFFVCASASITYSAFRGFYGKPLRFISSLKSILPSFFPILATNLVTQIIIGLIVFSFCFFMLLVYIGLALGLEMDYNSQYVLVFVFLIVALVMVFSVYLQVEWCLTTPVVMVESQWGFAALKRSWYLVKGMRGVVFSMILLFGIMFVLPSMWYWSFVAKGWSGWSFVLLMIVYDGLSTICQLYFMVANTVLFIYCKTLHGEEMASQFDEEMGVKYVRLDSDVAD